jgi:hypothetical protein
VFVRQVRCYDIVEKLYYSVGKYHIHYCSALAENSLTNTANCYPQSLECVAAGKELSFFSYSFDMIHSFILSQRFIDHTFHGSAGASRCMPLANTPLHAHTQVPTVVVLITYSCQSLANIAEHMHVTSSYQQVPKDSDFAA